MIIVNTILASSSPLDPHKFLFTGTALDLHVICGLS